MIKKFADKFFAWYCNPAYYEDIKGDLEEIYNNMLTEKSQRSSDWQFAKEVLLLFRPTIIRPFHFFNLQYTIAMFLNYVKIGFRNLMKYRMNTLIHILGLAIGLAAFLLINQYIWFEKSYDQHFPNADRIYRVSTDFVVEGESEVIDAMCYAKSPITLEEKLPEVISSTVTKQLLGSNFLKGQEPVKENIVAADSNFIKFFGFELIAGDPDGQLLEPKTVVLTESYAKKYFGNTNPVGKNMELSVFGASDKFLKVTGVIADPLIQTHYPFDILMSASTSSIRERMESDGWNQNNYYGYVKLADNTNIEQLQAKLPALSLEVMDEDGENQFYLMSIADIHLQSNMTYEPEVGGSERAVNFLGIISIFILLIAWINYVNLSTARAVERAREVGMRKVVGATRVQLMGQFFTESFLINLIAVLLALFLAQMALPYFNNLVGKDILTQIWTNSIFLKTALLFSFIGTLVTGLYPALVMSNFKPLRVLKGSFSRTKEGVWLRKGLVIFQFTASLILIAATFVVYQQIRYMTSQEMGIKPDQVVSFTNPDVNGDNYEAFKSKHKSFFNTLKQIPEITHTATIESVPGGATSEISSTSGEFGITGVSDPVSVTLYANFMSDQAADALGLNVIAGRNFDMQLASDSNALILNQSVLELFNIPSVESVINKEFNLWGDIYNVVGVIEDFNRSSLKNQIEPTLFFHGEMTDYNVVKLNTSDIAGTMKKVQSAWKEHFPNAPYDPIFLDEGFEKMYAEDQKFGSLFSNFSIFAIFVAILGLFALASYLSLQRKKEIAVRKVLGASTENIILLFFKDFVWLIVIAFFIATPLVFLGMSEWLNGYAFRIDFPWWSVVLSGVLLMLLAFVTVSLQTYRIAALNPAETVKTE